MSLAASEWTRLQKVDWLCAKLSASESWLEESGGERGKAVDEYQKKGIIRNLTTLTLKFWANQFKHTDFRKHPFLKALEE